MKSINNFYFLLFIATTLVASSTHCSESYSFLRWPTNNSLCLNKISAEESITFESLIGLEKQRKELAFVVDYIKKTEHYERSGITTSRGYLLTGPSGMRFDMQCLSNALVNELNKNCNQTTPFSYYVILPELITTMGVAAFAKEIKRHAPCVIYIHDIDDLAYTGNGAVLRDFLSFMHMSLEAERKNQVILLATTNHPENLYFNNRPMYNEIRFDFPNFQDRKALFQRVLARFKVSTQEFDFDQLAAETENCACRELLCIIKKALIQANKEIRQISQVNLEEAINTEIHYMLPQHQTTKVKRNISAQQDTVRLEKAVWDAYYTEEKASDKI